jgi:serpin B
MLRGSFGFCTFGPLALLLAGPVYPADYDAATTATNTLGIELFRQMAKPDENLCLSPYSIQTALAMTFAGADGETRTEMSRVLHLGSDETIDASFGALQKALDGSVHKSNDVATQSRKFGGPSEPITLAVANRLFPQSGYPIREEFAGKMQRFYGGNLEPLDFRANANGARQHINTWVAQQTRDRIQDLIPPNGVDKTTRLVLANALYLKAPWEKEFNDALTKPAPFHVRGRDKADVPTMRRVGHLGFLKKENWSLVAIPYVGSEMQFLILLPDEKSGGKQAIEKVTPQLLLEGAHIKETLVDLSLPKFKFSSPSLPLATSLKELGLKTAFDQPAGSANFDRMAPRKPNDYFTISEVFHKTFIAVDEKGTEAAAATAVAMVAGARAVREPEPIVVRVDRPFLYAIQHVPSGTCLFLGQVADPH